MAGPSFLLACWDQMQIGVSSGPCPTNVFCFVFYALWLDVLDVHVCAVRKAVQLCVRKNMRDKVIRYSAQHYIHRVSLCSDTFAGHTARSVPLPACKRHRLASQQPQRTHRSAAAASTAALGLERVRLDAPPSSVPPRALAFFRNGNKGERQPNVRSCAPSTLFG
jgi:hypothetical protein